MRKKTTTMELSVNSMRFLIERHAKTKANQQKKDFIEWAEISAKFAEEDERFLEYFDYYHNLAKDYSFKDEMFMSMCDFADKYNLKYYELKNN